MKNLDKKRERESIVLQEMITLYCDKHHSKNGCCKQCQELIDYGNTRIKNCPSMESKTFCSNCKVHCYKPEMREKIRMVMRYSGPRILFKHPVMAIWHIITSRLEKAKMIWLHLRQCMILKKK